MHSNTSQKVVFEYKDRILENYKISDGEKYRHFKIPEAEELCREKKRVIKTIKPANIEILLKEAEKRNVDLRVLLYFRQYFFPFQDQTLNLEMRGQFFGVVKRLVRLKSCIWTSKHIAKKK